MRNIRRLAAFLVSILMMGSCLGASAQEEGPLDQGEFTQRFCLLLQEAMPDIPVTQANDERIEVYLHGQEDPRQVWTNNMYGLYLRDPSALQGILAHYKDTVIDILQASKDTPDVRNIMPVIRSKGYLESFDEETLQSMVFEEWMPSLLIFYVWDFPKGVRNMNASELESLGLERDALRELACQNLARLAQGLRWTEEDGRYWAELDGMYETSLPLLSPWRKETFPAAKGDLMVAMPERGFLMVFGSEDTETIAAVLAYLLEAYETTPYALLNGLLRWDGEAFGEVSFVEAGK
ncbi:MAG: DUF1444 family protein [Firmicutes bacterium]|nr:DUF1444 family protein [Bacillota bacterium]